MDAGRRDGTQDLVLFTVVPIPVSFSQDGELPPEVTQPLRVALIPSQGRTCRPHMFVYGPTTFQRCYIGDSGSAWGWEGPNQSSGTASSSITHEQCEGSPSPEKTGHKGLYILATGLFLLFPLSPIVPGPCRSFALMVPKATTLQRCSALSDSPSPSSPAHVCASPCLRLQSFISLEFLTSIFLSFLSRQTHLPATSVSLPGEKLCSLEMSPL